MSLPIRLLKRFWHDEEGATMIEYALMVALIAIVIIASVMLVAQALDSTFTDVATQLNSAS